MTLLDMAAGSGSVQGWPGLRLACFLESHASKTLSSQTFLSAPLPRSHVCSTTLTAASLPTLTTACASVLLVSTFALEKQQSTLSCAAGAAFSRTVHCSQCVVFAMLLTHDRQTTIPKPVHLLSDPFPATVQSPYVHIVAVHQVEPHTVNCDRHLRYVDI